MSELQRQISALKSKHIQSQPLHEGRPSLFLSPSEAAAVDVSTIYETAIRGLNTLSQYDERLDVYKETVLHPSSVEIQRELKTVEENKAIDKSLGKLLNHLSLFVFEPNCHVVLEYLIRRYRIHELNVNMLLCCTIAAHETKMFARVVQLCKLDNSVWEFLGSVKASGVPLARTAIVGRCLKDNSFFESVMVKAVRNAIHLSDSSMFSDGSSLVFKGADRLLSFFTATVVEMGESRPFHDVQLRSVFPYLSEGLNSSSSNSNSGDGAVSLIREQHVRSCCMIIAQLSRKTNMSKALVKALSQALGQAFATLGQSGNHVYQHLSPIHSDVLTTMLVLTQQNKLKIGLQFIKHIFYDTNLFGETVTAADDTRSLAPSNSSFLTMLKQLGRSFDISPFISSLVNSATNGLLKSAVSSGSSSSGDDTSTEDKAALGRVLIMVLSVRTSDIGDNSSSSNATAALAKANSNALSDSIHKILHLVCASPKSEGMAKFEPVVQVVRFASQRYPTEFNVCIEKAASSCERGEDDEGEGEGEEGEKDQPQSNSSTTITHEERFNHLMNFLNAALSDNPTFLGSSSSSSNGGAASTASSTAGDFAGSSLLLSLCSSIPQIRVRALQAYATIPFPDPADSATNHKKKKNKNNKSPSVYDSSDDFMYSDDEIDDTAVEDSDNDAALNMQGVSAEVCRLLLDSNTSVSAVAWQSAVLVRLCHPQWGVIVASKPSSAEQLWSTVNTAVRYWSARITSAALIKEAVPVASAAVQKSCGRFTKLLSALFDEKAVIEAMMDCAEEEEEAGFGDDTDNNKSNPKVKKSNGAMQLTATLFACAAGLPVAAAADLASNSGSSSPAVLEQCAAALLTVRYKSFEALQKMSTGPQAIFAPAAAQSIHMAATSSDQKKKITKKPSKAAIANKTDSSSIDALSVTAVSSPEALDAAIASLVAENMQNASTAMNQLAQFAAGELRADMGMIYSQVAADKQQLQSVAMEGLHSPLRFAVALVNTLLVAAERASEPDVGAAAVLCVRAAKPILFLCLRSLCLFSKASTDVNCKLLAAVHAAGSRFLSLMTSVGDDIEGGAEGDEEEDENASAGTGTVMQALGIVLSGGSHLQPLLGEAINGACSSYSSSSQSSNNNIAASLHTLALFALPSTAIKMTQYDDALQYVLSSSSSSSLCVNLSARLTALYSMGSAVKALAAAGNKEKLSAMDIAVILACIIGSISAVSTSTSTSNNNNSNSSTSTSMALVGATRRAGLSLANRLLSACESGCKMDSGGSVAAALSLICNAIKESSTLILSDNISRGNDSSEVLSVSAVSFALKKALLDPVARKMLMGTVSDYSKWARAHCSLPILHAVMHATADSVPMPRWFWEMLQKLSKDGSSMNHTSNNSDNRTNSCEKELVEAVVSAVGPSLRLAMTYGGDKQQQEKEEKEKEDDLSEEIVHWAADILEPSADNVRSMFRQMLLVDLAHMPTIAAATTSNSSSSVKQKKAAAAKIIFDQLAILQEKQPGHRGVLAALAAVASRVAVTVPLSVLRVALTTFTAQINAISSSAEEDNDSSEEDDEKEEEGNRHNLTLATTTTMNTKRSSKAPIVGLSVPIHTLSCALEGLVPCVLSSAAATCTVDLSAVAVQSLAGSLVSDLLDALALLCNSPALQHQQQKQRLATTTRYAQSLVIDAAAQCLSLVTTITTTTALSTTVTPRKTSKKKRSASEDNCSAEGYSAGRVQQDVQQLLIVMGGSDGAAAVDGYYPQRTAAAGATGGRASATLTTAAFDLLKQLLRLQPSAALPSLKLLGGLVAGSTNDVNVTSGSSISTGSSIMVEDSSFQNQTGNGGIVEQMLRIFTACSMTTEAASSSAKFDLHLIQDLMQAVCGNFQSAVDVKTGARQQQQQAQRRMRCISLAMRAVLAESGAASSSFSSSSSRHHHHHHHHQPQQTQTQTHSTQTEVVSTSLMSASTVLLVHAVAAFNGNNHHAAISAADVEEDDNEEESASAPRTGTAALLLLSKASHRRANREIRTSPAEEFFQQSVEVIVSGGGLRSSASSASSSSSNSNSNSSGKSMAVMQVRAVCGMLSSAHRALESALGGTATHNPSSCSAIAADLEKTSEYYLEITKSNSGGSKSESWRGLQVAVATLQLQCILQVLDNKQFHRALLSLADDRGNASSSISDSSSSSSSKSRAVQQHFLEFADAVLQLLAYATSVEQGCSSEAEGNVLLILGDSLGTTASDDNSGGSGKKKSSGGSSSSVRRMSVMAVGRSVSEWCATALRSLQRLLDTPALVTILQELVSHGSLAVRQSALAILGDRLETLTLSEVKNNNEVNLFLDLNLHLRKVVQEEFSPALEAAVAVYAASASNSLAAKNGSKSAKKARKSTDAALAAVAAVTPEQVQLAKEFPSRTALAQSAIMCTDILARFLGANISDDNTSSSEWEQQLGDTLSETVLLSAELCKVLTNSSAGGSRPQRSNEDDNDDDEEEGTVRDRGTTITSSMKLLGTVYLCCGTLCSTVAGVKALATLGKLMNSMLVTMEQQTSVLTVYLNSARGESDDNSDDDDDDDTSSVTDAAASTSEASVRLLLIRSVVTAITQLSSSITQFFHPYIKRTLISTLQLSALQQLGFLPGWASVRGAVNGVLEDADRCRSTMVKKIPARLSVPALLESTPVIIDMAVDSNDREEGRGCAIIMHYTKLLGDIWRNLDRPTVLAHQHSLTSLAVHVLDYRRQLYVHRLKLLSQGHSVGLGSLITSLERACLSKEEGEEEEEEDDVEANEEEGEESKATTTGAAARGDNANRNHEGAVEDTIAQAVVELCLKLTESELRTFLRELSDWKDASVVSGSKRAAVADSDNDNGEDAADGDSSANSGVLTARAVSYYSLIAALSAKLKSIFVPSFAFVWFDATQRLKSVSEASDAAASAMRSLTSAARGRLDETDRKSSSKKKRKSSGAVVVAEQQQQQQDEDEEQQQQQDPLTQWQRATDIGMSLILAHHVLGAVRLCCDHDAHGFVDESRFEEMMPVVISMLTSTQQAFALVHTTSLSTLNYGSFEGFEGTLATADAQFIGFCANSVATCASSLAVAVTDRSALWKPLNHKVLLTTRDKRKAVRVAAVKTLQHLFSSVGEEYLQLLPECLPFLSELLEDDSEEVTTATGAAVRFIEELSGEQLDEYLM